MMSNYSLPPAKPLISSVSQKIHTMDKKLCRKISWKRGCKLCKDFLKECIPILKNITFNFENDSLNAFKRGGRITRNDCSVI